MKEIKIIGAEVLDRIDPADRSGIIFVIKGNDNMSVSDGYHTFDELYDHRITLFIALCKQIINQPYDSKKYIVWRSKLHSDGSKIDGWFILGIGIEINKQITYHLPLSEWEKTDFVVDETFDKAPEWDGHISADVLERLKDL